jgi:hypothetical protein
MEDAYFAEENDGDTTAFALAHLCAQSTKKGFNVLSRDVGAGWMGEHSLKCSLMSALHACIAPDVGTGGQGRSF